MLLASYYVFEHWIPGSLGNFLFNIYFGLYSLYALITLRSARNRRAFGVVLPFLYFSFPAYLTMAVLSVVFMIFPPLRPGLINMLSGGVFSFLWGGVTLGYLLRKSLIQEFPDNESLPRDFIEQFGITGRERETVALLLRGSSNRDIGEKLFVSPRTIEAHIYNVYRKCGVKNKMELVNLIQVSKNT